MFFGRPPARRIHTPPLQPPKGGLSVAYALAIFSTGV
jgi:hypothetical protein